MSMTRVNGEFFKPEGDFRGPYGYGRPAHKADPSASYVFDVKRPADDLTAPVIELIESAAASAE